MMVISTYLSPMKPNNSPIQLTVSTKGRLVNNSRQITDVRLGAQQLNPDIPYIFLVCIRSYIIEEANINNEGELIP